LARAICFYARFKRRLKLTSALARETALQEQRERRGMDDGNNKTLRKMRHAIDSRHSSMDIDRVGHPVVGLFGVRSTQGRPRRCEVSSSPWRFAR
jgi:hypothetical protein